MTGRGTGDEAEYDDDDDDDDDDERIGVKPRNGSTTGMGGGDVWDDRRPDMDEGSIGLGDDDGDDNGVVAKAREDDPDPAIDDDDDDGDDDRLRKRETRRRDDHMAFGSGTKTVIEDDCSECLHASNRSSKSDWKKNGGHDSDGEDDDAKTSDQKKQCRD